MEVSMAEYASKGVAGTGLGLGIAGTVALANQLFGGGLFNNLGSNCGSGSAIAVNALAEKDAKIAELTAQKYSDNQDSALYVATRAENKSLREEMLNYIKPLADESAKNRERVAVLEACQKKNEEINALREQLCKCELNSKIDSVASSASCGISQLNNAVSCLSNTLNSITKTVIPTQAICPEVMPRYNSWEAPTATPAVKPQA